MEFARGRYVTRRSSRIIFLQKGPASKLKFNAFLLDVKVYECLLCSVDPLAKPKLYYPMYELAGKHIDKSHHQKSLVFSCPHCLSQDLPVSLQQLSS